MTTWVSPEIDYERKVSRRSQAIPVVLENIILIISGFILNLCNLTMFFNNTDQ